MKASFFAAAALLAAAPAAAQPEAGAPAAEDVAAPSSEAAAANGEDRSAEEFLQRLDSRTGTIRIDAADVTLTVPEGFYFLDAEDARAVLEEAWGNPPDETTLGMLLPAGRTPLDEGVWGATFNYSEDGYVSDKEAGKINYDDLLKSLKDDAAASNAWREENGYAPIEIIGWAEAPSYDAATHKMYWAKELKFGAAEINTLNYDIRALGRRGVLVVSFIADMTALGEIRAAAPSVLDMVSFDEGSRYADYQPGVDKKAAYGLAGLITGGLIAKKTGLLAALLLFGKKFAAFIIAGLAAAGAYVRKLLAKKS